MKRTSDRGARRPPDIDETKEHVLAAGRELLLAAQGALSLCKDYAKASSSPESRSQLMQFFSKAMDVADELSKGLISASRIPGAARGVAGQVFDAIGREMKEQEEQGKKGREKKQRSKKEKAAKRRQPCRKNIRRS